MSYYQNNSHRGGQGRGGRGGRSHYSSARYGGDYHNNNYYRGGGGGGSGEYPRGFPRQERNQHRPSRQQYQAPARSNPQQQGQVGPNGNNEELMQRTLNLENIFQCKKIDGRAEILEGMSKEERVGLFFPDEVQSDKLSRLIEPSEWDKKVKEATKECAQKIRDAFEAIKSNPDDDDDDIPYSPGPYSDTYALGAAPKEDDEDYQRFLRSLKYCHPLLAAFHVAPILAEAGLNEFCFCPCGRHMLKFRQVMGLHIDGRDQCNAKGRLSPQQVYAHICACAAPLQAVPNATSGLEDGFLHQILQWFLESVFEKYYHQCPGIRHIALEKVQDPNYKKAKKILMKDVDRYIAEMTKKNRQYEQELEEMREENDKIAKVMLTNKELGQQLKEQKLQLEKLKGQLKDKLGDEQELDFTKGKRFQARKLFDKFLEQVRNNLEDIVAVNDQNKELGDLLEQDKCSLEEDAAGDDEKKEFAMIVKQVQVGLEEEDADNDERDELHVPVKQEECSFDEEAADDDNGSRLDGIAAEKNEKVFVRLAVGKSMDLPRLFERWYAKAAGDTFSFLFDKLEESKCSFERLAVSKRWHVDDGVAKDGGGPTRAFFSKVWDQIGDLKSGQEIDSFQLFESTNGGLLPQTDEFVASKCKGDNDAFKRVHAYYRAFGRLLAHAILSSDNVAISSHVLPCLLMNILFRDFDVLNAEQYFPGDLANHFGPLLGTKNRKGLTKEQYEHQIFQNMGVKTPQEFRETLNDYFLDSRKEILKSIREGLSIGGRIEWSTCLHYVPTKSLTRLLGFSRRTIKEKDIIEGNDLRFIKFTTFSDDDEATVRKYKAIQDEFKSKLPEWFKKKHKENDAFVSNFIDFCTGSKYLPDIDLNPDWCITVEFNYAERMRGNRDPNDHANADLPVVHTCDKCMVIPADAYGADIQVFEKKLALSMTLSYDDFDMG